MSSVLLLRHNRKARLIFYALMPWPVLGLYLAGSAINRYAPDAWRERFLSFSFLVLFACLSFTLSLAWYFLF
jgi:hypothetical protein